MMSLVQLTYHEVEELWLREDMWGSKLYAGHTSENLYFDGIKYFGGTDKRQKNVDWSHPAYYGVKVNGKLVGVNSYYKSSEICARSRGLYVLPDYRSVGMATYLLEHAIEANRDKDYQYMWSMPRAGSTEAYQRAGFKIIQEEDGELTSVLGLNSLIHPVYFARYNYKG